jgi:hypothetical protein
MGRALHNFTRADGAFQITLPDLVFFVALLRWREQFGEGALINEQTTPHLFKLLSACEKGVIGEIVRGWEDQFAGR